MHSSDESVQINTTRFEYPRYSLVLVTVRALGVHRGPPEALGRPARLLGGSGGGDASCRSSSVDDGAW